VNTGELLGATPSWPRYRAVSRCAPLPRLVGAFAVVIPTTSLSTGVHLLTDVYLGDGHFAPSSSPVFTEVITGPGY